MCPRKAITALHVLYKWLKLPDNSTFKNSGVSFATGEPIRFQWCPPDALLVYPQLYTKSKVQLMSIRPMLPAGGNIQIHDLQHPPVCNDSNNCWAKLWVDGMLGRVHYGCRLFICYKIISVGWQISEEKIYTYSYICVQYFLKRGINHLVFLGRPYTIP